MSIEQLRSKAQARLGSLPREIEVRSLKDVVALVGEVNTSNARLRDFYVERGSALLDTTVVRPKGRRKGSGGMFPAATEDESLRKFWRDRDQVRRALVAAAIERREEKRLQQPTDKEIANAMGMSNKRTGQANNTYNARMRKCRQRGIAKSRG